MPAACQLEPPDEVEDHRISPAAQGGAHRAMTAGLSFRLAGWAAGSPGTEGLETGGRTRTAVLPASLRRRVTPIGRKALEAAWAVLSPDGPTPRLVLSSRHGEYARTEGLLSSLADDGTVSPAEFSLSVHHALVGLLSIATGNRGGHTAIAAGAESFGYGLLEAASCLSEDGGPVVLIHFDAPLPEAYGTLEGLREPALAVALALEPADGKGEAMELGVTPGSDGAAAPLAPAFLAFLRSPAAEARASGTRSTWRWRRA